MHETSSKIRQVTLNVDVGYAISALGIMKVVQFVFLLIAWACMADCYLALDVMYGGRYRFFLFVTIYGWFCIIFLYVCFLLMLTNKINLPAVISDVRIVVVIFEATWALLLLISASLVADAAAKNGNNTYSVWKSYYGEKRNNGHNNNLDTMITAVAFGFCSLVVFIVDIVFLILKIIKSRQAVWATPRMQLPA